MCEDRERLIGFVYGETTPDEKRVIEEHLQTCHDCREEIRGLRSVRQDLLAWEVPESAPVWRPAVPQPHPSPWRDIPAWALAAAACAILMVGAAGGAATYAFLPTTATVVATAPAAAPVPVSAVTPLDQSVDVAAIEARLLERMRAELDARVRLAAAERPAPDSSDLARRVNVLSARQDELSELLLGLANETVGIRTKQSVLERDNRQLVSYMLHDGAAFPGGR